VHDDAGYVPRELLAEFAAKDPLDRFRGWLEEVEEVGEDELAALEDGVAAWIDAGVAEAEASPMPDPVTATDRVYG
jgi:TPP-dependent pyruvate/acetoin dehydrogenase alpha subunit